MLNKVLSVLLLSLFVSTARAQDNKAMLKAIEDSLVIAIDTMYERRIPDEMPMMNERIVKQLVRALKIEGSYYYPFDSLSKRINIIYPEDKSFRIFNWAIAPEENTRRYYAAMQMKSETLKLYPLIDCSGDLGKMAEDTVLTKGKWFGVIYYRILTKEVDGKKIYTMFGANTASPIISRKIMEPMEITENGPVFGAPMFNIRSKNNPEQRISRFILEYKKFAQVALNWDADMNAVYYDHLESEVNDPNRKYTYVPSGQYDGLRWADGYWNMVQDLIPIDALKDGAAPVPQPYKGRGDN